MARQQFSCPSCSMAFRCSDAPHAQPAQCPTCGQVVTRAAEAAAERWYYAHRRRKVGPFTRDQLRALTATGHVRPADLVWEEGDARWLPASDVPGLCPGTPRSVRRRRLLLPLTIAAAVLAVLTALIAVVASRNSDAASTLGVPWVAARLEPQPQPQTTVKGRKPPPAPAGGARVRPATAAVLCPAGGDTQVPLAFTGRREIPGAVRGQEIHAGYPITATFPPTASVRQVRATLHDGGGRPVSAWLSTPESSTHPRGQRNTVALIAREVLQPDTAYRVRIEAEVDGVPWARAWEFRTPGDTADRTLTTKALKKVNEARRLAGLNAVVLDDELSKGCTAHARYLARNPEHPSTSGLGAHDEDPALPGFSEEGRKAGKASVIAWGAVDPLGSVDGWLATLYHRVPLLDPQLRRVGFGHTRRGGGWVTVLDARRGRQPGQVPTVVLFPAAGQKDVPLAFPAGEEPNPIPLAKDGRAGFPVTVTFSRGAPPRDLALTLYDDAGHEVPAWFSSPERPANPKYARHQGTTACLIAKEPLRPLTTYTVRGAGKSGRKPWRQKWSFTTGDGSAGDAAAEVLARINAHRRAAGLTVVVLDKALSKGCAAHAAYLVRNAGHTSVRGAGVHREEANLPGFSAEGAAAARHADILARVPAPRVHVDELMGTVFRRVYVLDPALQRIGFGCALDAGKGWVCVLDLVRGRADQAVAVDPRNNIAVQGATF